MGYGRHLTCIRSDSLGLWRLGGFGYPPTNYDQRMQMLLGTPCFRSWRSKLVFVPLKTGKARDNWPSWRGLLDIGALVFR